MDFQHYSFFLKNNGDKSLNLKIINRKNHLKLFTSCSIFQFWVGLQNGPPKLCGFWKKFLLEIERFWKRRPPYIIRLPGSSRHVDLWIKILYSKTCSCSGEKASWSLDPLGPKQKIPRAPEAWRLDIKVVIIILVHQAGENVC